MKFINLLIKQHPNRLHAQRGFWIGPMVGSILVFIVVSGIIYGIVRSSRGSVDTILESKSLLSVVSGARMLKSGGSFAAVDNTALQRVNAFGNMTGSAAGGTVRNGWGGTVVVTGTTSQLEVQWNAVPAKACDAFLASAKESGEFATPLPTCAESGDSDLTFIAY